MKTDEERSDEEREVSLRCRYQGALSSLVSLLRSSFILTAYVRHALLELLVPRHEDASPEPAATKVLGHGPDHGKVVVHQAALDLDYRRELGRSEGKRMIRIIRVGAGVVKMGRESGMRCCCSSG